MKLFKQVIVVVMMAVVMLGFSGEQQAYAKRQDSAQESTKKKEVVADIKIKHYRKNVEVLDGRKCTKYFEDNFLQLQAYGVNSKGKKVNQPVTVKEHNKILRAKKGKVYITLVCGQKTKRVTLENVIKIKKVHVKANGVKLIEKEKLTEAMIKKLTFQIQWKNGKISQNYRWAQCLDIGKTIKDNGKFNFKIGSKIVKVKIPVIKAQKPIEKQHKWGQWISKNNKEHARQCSNCKKTETKPHEYKVLYETKKDGEKHIKISICQICKNRQKEEQCCQYGTCSYIGNNLDAVKCKYCKYQKTMQHVHEEVPENIQYMYEGGTNVSENEHQLKGYYNCLICLKTVEVIKNEKCEYETIYEKKENEDKHIKSDICPICRHTKQEEDECQWNKWCYIGNSTEGKKCKYCNNYKTKPHEHTQAPANIQYVYEGAAGNGVEHEVKGYYNCKTCLRTVVLSKKVRCQFEISYKQKENSDMHIAIYVCPICKYLKEADESCSYDISYKPKEDVDEHIQTSTCRQCRKSKQEELACQFDDSSWSYIGNDTEVNNCKYCNKPKTRKHEHESVPEDLQYVYKQSNMDETHEYEGTYICTICGATVTVTKKEECSFEITGYERTGQNDIHLIVQTCTICQYEKKDEGACEPVGELKYQRRNSQIYEYFDCGLCGDWCNRAYHDHSFNTPWEYYDINDHQIECACQAGSEAIVREEHDFEYDSEKSVLFCAICNYEMPVTAHDHGLDVVDGMNLYDLVLSDAYKYEILSPAQSYNPNPQVDKYCYRYNFRCRTCGVKYFVEYAHSPKDGAICTRSKCKLSKSE